MNTKTYNPQTSASLKKADLDAMRNLTSEEISELAKAYPNKASQNAYLVLADKTKEDKDQIYPLSTWQNLHDLHKIGQTNFVAAGFKDAFERPVGDVPTAPAQDLTGEDLTKAEGTKTAAAQKVVEGQGPDGTAPAQTVSETKTPPKAPSKGGKKGGKK